LGEYSKVVGGDTAGTTVLYRRLIYTHSG